MGFLKMPGSVPSSVRRIRQLLFLRPDLEPVEIRGNVPTPHPEAQPTRRTTSTPSCSPGAGLERLGIFGDEAGLDYSILDPVSFLPAAAQGAVGIEIHSRSGNRVTDLLTAIPLSGYW